MATRSPKSRRGWGLPSKPSPSMFNPRPAIANAAMGAAAVLTNERGLGGGRLASGRRYFVDFVQLGDAENDHRYQPADDQHADDRVPDNAGVFAQDVDIVPDSAFQLEPRGNDAERFQGPHDERDQEGHE